jgi:hypothetical protein
MAMTATALGASAAVYFLGGKGSQNAQADPRVTTEAAVAGARTLPTVPKLKVEPK